MGMLAFTGLVPSVADSRTQQDRAHTIVAVADGGIEGFCGCGAALPCRWRPRPEC